ncbi:hypothetical protein [Bradyrhizobium sp. RDI18]|uniref:hypothetical protein n=1 Tax=Bradyrhizobium sp. RDI18 TaxID=3367400 RepID=UPI00371B7DDB
MTWATRQIRGIINKANGDTQNHLAASAFGATVLVAFAPIHQCPSQNQSARESSDDELPDHTLQQFSRTAKQLRNKDIDHFWRTLGLNMFLASPAETAQRRERDWSAPARWIEPMKVLVRRHSSCPIVTET